MFFTSIRLRTHTAFIVAMVMWFMAVPLASHAEFIPTQALLDEQPSQDAASRVRNFLAAEQVQLELARYGVTVEEAQARVASLSTEEIEQLAATIDTAPTGGDALGTVIVAVVAVFLILLLTDILGLTKVYPFTKPISRR